MTQVPCQSGRPSGKPSPRSLLVVNQVVGPLCRELLEDLAAEGVRCRVLAGWVDAAEGERLPFDVVRGVRLRKAPTWRRLWTWSAFAVQGIRRMLRRPTEPVLIVTNPPPVMLAAPWLARLAGLEYAILVYDIYPDTAERMGLLKPGGLPARVWRRLSGEALRRARGVVTLGEHMADTLRRHVRPKERLRIDVIPNWADTDVIRPVPKRDNPFAREHGLTEKFVVMYSGSFGATHDLGSVVAAAGRLRDLEDVHFVLIGGGTREQEVAELVASAGLSNLTLLPFQPLAMLPYSLAAADCAIVCLDEGFEGIAVPSKLYSSLAAGSAILAISPPETELTDVVAETGCGVALPPRRPDRLAEAVRRLHGDRERLGRCRQAARRAAEERFSRRLATGRYRDFLARCFGP